MPIYRDRVSIGNFRGYTQKLIRAISYEFIKGANKLPGQLEPALHDAAPDGNRHNVRPFPKIKDSMRVSIRRASFALGVNLVITSEAPHLGSYIYGSVEHPITGNPLQFVGTNDFAGRRIRINVVNHPGNTHPDNFIQNVIDDSEEKIDEIFGRAVDRVLKRT